MVKKILSVALVAMSLAAMPIMAQTSESAQSEQSSKKDCKKANKKDCKKDRMARKSCDKQNCEGEVISLSEFEGLSLNDNQREQLTQLKQKRIDAKNDRKAALKAQKDAKKLNDGKIAKSEKDGKKLSESERNQAREERAEIRKQMKEMRTAERKEYLKEVKKIVGDNNYILFLENEFVSASHPMDRNGAIQVKANRGDKKMHRGDMKFKSRSNNGKEMSARSMKASRSHNTIKVENQIAK